ncbi:efflux RND transporter periplasmic adaptor subunit [Piscinibacter sp.]|uniref:efflux RND transporter periplasmic adaptor subunit n=1 Tax=Piscinibacter sp. TaxID=1903157 RepID=UPI002CB01CDC|nr:efflux RND transporter periplasmic adaptor subunit [Albitalea sp.]HUG25259.1 efflux RND transporter periplasmic adaptor subunit [Albitalea sp.]
MTLKALRTLVGGALLAAMVAAASDNAPAASAPTPQVLATAPVTSSSAADVTGLDGVVQAVRQTAVAAQVSGAVVSLDVKAGDAVKAGQVLLRLDARAAEQTAAAGAAQVQAARAAQDAATKDFERQKQLFDKNYISRAALDRAEAQYKATQAESSAQLAAAGATRTQSGFYVVKAPYDGIVSDVAVVLGDMAMPGRPLLTVYDPRSLRVSVAVPQRVAARLAPGHAVQVELPGSAAGHITPTAVQLLPTVDPATHTLELRLNLPGGLSGAAPGMFARAWLSIADGAGTRLYVPARAVVRRAELNAVYVVGGDGRALLRQVRLGRVQGDTVEVLAGVSAGERVALDPQAVARLY